MHNAIKPPALRRRLGAAALVAADLLRGRSCMAGECPADKVTPAPASQERRSQRASPIPSSPPSTCPRKNLKDRQMRIRRLVVQPGGVVPWHSHEDRPALIYIVSGTIQEYASNCSVPIEHGGRSRSRSSASSTGGRTLRRPVVLLSSDVFHETRPEDQHMM